MKPALAFILFSSILILNSCKDKLCDEPNTIHIPDTKDSKLTFHWQVWTSPNPNPSNAKPVASPLEDNAFIELHDSVNTSIALVAEDPKAGVKCVKITEASYVVACSNADKTLSEARAKLPAIEICKSGKTCCLISQQASVENIGQYIKCKEGKTFYSGRLQLTGIVESCAGNSQVMALSIGFKK